MLNRKKKLYTAVLSAIKVIPFVMAFIYIAAIIMTCYYGLDNYSLSAIAGNSILPGLFLIITTFTLGLDFFTDCLYISV